MIDRRQQTTGPPEPGTERRSALVSLLLLATAVILGADLAVATGTSKTVAVVVALIVMIMLHELGHYVTAKWSGMKVTEFFLGFGPRLWSVRKGETEYGIKAIPAGGYVKIVGMNNLERVDAADEPRTYRQQPYPRRLAVALAGSVMHFVIALVLFWVVNALIGIPRATLQVGTISKLESGPSPAEAAGFRVGDRILSVDGHEFRQWADLPPYIRERPGQELRFAVERDGQVHRLVARPIDLSTLRAQGMPAPDRPTGFVGIGPLVAFEKVDPVSAVGISAKNVGTGLVEVVRALARILSPSGLRDYWRVLAGEPTSMGSPDGGETRFLSPVGFVRIASQAADTGLFQVLQLLIAINLFVGVFNLLPLLPLDGGHVAIATYEAVRSRISRRRYHVDVAKLLPATYLVFFLLVFLGVTSLYLDIVRPLTNPFQ
jgi:membrane-associated protease RseP (regulator of RpoE activity)